jgi:hypothetical protein
MKRPQPVTASTKTTAADKIAATAFWLLVLGYPLFIVLWRTFAN